MKSLLVCVCFLLGIVVVSTGFGYGEPQTPNSNESVSTLLPTQEPSTEDSFAPVDNMHHFMEYISEPNYLALKKALATEPENRRAWKPVKSSALILTETMALVASRAPDDADDEQKKQWKQISLDVYNAGKELYGSIGDYEKAKVNFGAMIDNCNRCHQAFDDGKHQLEK